MGLGDLYWDVMLENFALVASLGKSFIISPVSLIRLFPFSFLQGLLFLFYSQSMDIAYFIGFLA